MNHAPFARSTIASFAASFVAACIAVGPLAGAAAAQKSFLTWDGNTAGDSLGYSVAGAGDVNNDGYPDVIVGARDDSPSGISGAGSAYVYSGKDGTLIWAVHGTQAGEVFGYSVAGVGDLNHDGFADFAVGATQWDNAVGTMNVGAVHVFNGKTGAKFFTSAARR